jgi:hypothetical protein
MLYLVHVERYKAHPRDGINDRVGWDHTDDPRYDGISTVFSLFLGFFLADRRNDAPRVSAYDIFHKPRRLFVVFEGHTYFRW